MKWVQKARIELVVDDKHLDDWSSEREAELVKFIFSEFHIDPEMSEVTIDVQKAKIYSIRFTVALMSDLPSALRVAKVLEREFFKVKILERRVNFEKNLDKA